jgi:hypothetical protein
MPLNKHINSSLAALICCLSWLTVPAQDRTLLYLGAYTDDATLKTLSDSLQKPLLVTKDRVYAIGTSCITRLFDGSMNDRDKDGADNDRNQSGNSNQRIKDGNSDNRNRGGGVDDRSKSGTKNGRAKDGDNDDRNKSGESDNRNKTGGANDRNADGALSKQTGCSTDRSGKILLYVRSDIDTKHAKIYFKDRFFSTRYFQIIPL